MNWSRKGALLMLAVVVFWTAMPASACLLGFKPMRQHDCCRRMARMCTSAGMAASGACCQASPRNTAVAPDPPYTPEHAQKLVIIPQQASLRAPATLRAGYGHAFKAPPPKAASSSASILRI
ncbi:MAG: hypothetical protein KGM96_01815 [Acidobacteriota bacterium]|nr:hypothetical protein [Acidobacteriota bacterium]